MPLSTGNSIYAFTYGNGTTGIAYRRPEYQEAITKWLAVDDTQKGQQRIKCLGEYYLPFFGTQLRSVDAFSCTEDYQAYLRQYNSLTQEEATRYINYKKRAVFYNYIAPTVAGLVGLATKANLEFEADDGLEFAEDNVDGAGTTLEQQYKRTTELVIKHGRAGILVDFPGGDEDASQEDVNNGISRPYSTVYTAEQIINWGDSREGAEKKINLVVLAEVQWNRAENGFDLELDVQFRVLKLEGGVYTQDVRNTANEIIEGPFTPRDSAGNTLDFIPFQFIGSVNNDTDVDESKMYDMAAINVGHYVNSADYENASWLVGQPIPWASGVDKNWVDQNMPGGVQLGSGAMFVVPQGEKFGIEQVQPNIMAFEAMSHKENQMIALGAKMINPNGSFDSATEAAINNQSEASFLQSVMDNVESGYTRVLEWMGLFSGAEVEEFSNPTDLESYLADPQMLAQVIASWTTGLTSKEDARAYQRDIGVLKRTNEEIDDDIDNDTSGILDGVETDLTPAIENPNSGQ